MGGENSNRLWCAESCFFLHAPCVHVQKVSSTETLTQLHKDFEQSVLSVGWKILPRWYLMPREGNSCQRQTKYGEEPEQMVQELEKTSREEVANEKGTPTSEIPTAEVRTAEAVPALSSVTSDSSPGRPKLHKDLSCSVPSEVSL